MKCKFERRKDNWTLIVDEYEALLDMVFVREYDNSLYRFFGLVHASDDYYYGMIKLTDHTICLSTCVASLKRCGFEPVEHFCIVCLEQSTTTQTSNRVGPNNILIEYHEEKCSKCLLRFQTSKQKLKHLEDITDNTDNTETNALSCEHCGEGMSFEAGPSGIFYGCNTVHDQKNIESGYCKGYWEFHQIDPTTNSINTE